MEQVFLKEKKSRNNVDKAKPFLKWVGGKGQLIPELTERLPSAFNRYFEPFIGGGALFFFLKPKKAYISDINPDLINTYQVVQTNVSALIRSLKKHYYCKDYFYDIRSADRQKSYSRWGCVRKASRFIFLNKTCFNGLYRVNSKGYFNVPFGSYKNPKILDEPNLLACSNALQDVDITVISFDRVESKADSGDFIYFDPPYVPLNLTSNFTGYSKEGFDINMQVELRDLCISLNKKGVKFMLSNSSSPLILDLYKDFDIEFVNAARSINSIGGRRGKIKEVLVRNYIVD